MPFHIADIVPGGLKPGDHIHRKTNDGSCSRCRRQVPEDEVPLMIWISGDDLLIYCGPCLETTEPEGNPDEQHA